MGVLGTTRWGEHAHDRSCPGTTSQARAFYLRWAAAKTLVQAGHVTLLFTLHLGGMGRTPVVQKSTSG